MKPSLVVVGSANMDMVVRVKEFPRPGETIFGSGFGMFPGGKGANQAVCAAKLGARVKFIGKVGRDILGARLMSNMRQVGVDLRHVSEDHDAATGIALITIERGGQNEIVVASGANMKLMAADLRRQKSAFQGARVVLTQLEVPTETVGLALKYAKSGRAFTILNPAPARTLPARFFPLIDVLTPNETEAEILTGIRVASEDQAVRASRKLLAMGVKNVILTRGARGSLWVDKNGVKKFPAVRVNAVDTTAAGDAFSGALAVALGGGQTIPQGIRFASRVAAYSVTRPGAQPSMPSLSQLRRSGI